MKSQVNPVKAVSVVKPVKSMNVQDKFLKEVLNKVVTIKTIDGEEVTGMLKFFDKFSIRLDFHSKLKILIYKSAIARINVED